MAAVYEILPEANNVLGTWAIPDTLLIQSVKKYLLLKVYSKRRSRSRHEVRPNISGVELIKDLLKNGDSINTLYSALSKSL